MPLNGNARTCHTEWHTDASFCVGCYLAPRHIGMAGVPPSAAIIRRALTVQGGGYEKS